MATNRTGSGGTRRVVRELSNCSLEILPDKDEKKSPTVKAGSSKSSPSLRASSSRSGQRAPPVATTTASQRRPATPPTKKVLLAAPRHPEPSDMLSADELAQLTEMKKLGQKSSLRKTSPPLSAQNSTEKPLSSSSAATIDSDSSSSVSATTTSATDGASDMETKNRNKSKKYLSKSVKEFQKLEGKEPNHNNANCEAGGQSSSGVNIEDSDEFDTDLESGEESSSDEEEPEKRKAPNELMMEFLECVMANDYENAQKLCRMILLYEPDHPEALKFKELIEQKIEIEKEKENESSGDEDEGEEDSSDEDDDDDDDDDDSDSDNSSNEEDSDEEKDDTETAAAAKPTDNAQATS